MLDNSRKCCQTYFLCSLQFILRSFGRENETAVILYSSKFRYWLSMTFFNKIIHIHYRKHRKRKRKSKSLMISTLEILTLLTFLFISLFSTYLHVCTCLQSHTHTHVYGKNKILITFIPLFFNNMRSFYTNFFISFVV